MMTMTTTMRMCVHDDDGEGDEDGDDDANTDVGTDDDNMHNIQCGVARGMCMAIILAQRA